MKDDELFPHKANRQDESIDIADSMLNVLPGYVIRKARNLHRSAASNETFLSSLDQVLIKQNFAVFCSLFTFHALALVHDEMSKDFSRDDAASFMADTRSNELRSWMLATKHEIMSRCDAVLGRRRVWENLQAHIQIRIAEDNAVYLLERYAPQTVFSFFQISLYDVPVYPDYLEEAKNRKLPALEKILSNYLPHLEAQRRLQTAMNPDGTDGPS